MSLSEARREILQKSRGQIEEETAFKWAYRAMAAYQLFKETGWQHWLSDAGSYLHEAVEHAALADESGEVLRTVRERAHQSIPHGAI